MLRIKTNMDVYNVGETVKIKLTLCNDSGQNRIYTFPSGKQFDVTARNGLDIVWRWSDGQMFTMAFTSFTLAPGRCMTFRAEWDQRDMTGQQVKRGTYTLHGIIVGTNEEATTTIEIQ